uniref:MSP domain-containing protein n=1 Tax=Rhabditophanes sp. KR3021 TaxID=114890 RepID=A0AC35TIF1_9BILA
MATVAPGDIATAPNAKLVFNAPYDDKHTYHIKITNAGGRRIGWAIKTTNMKRLAVDPPCGVLDPKEGCLMAVSCDTFLPLFHSTTFIDDMEYAVNLRG